jgi:tetratricopeptide (TPR) repeat protein
MFAEAISELKKAAGLSPASTEIQARLGFAYGMSGNSEEAGKILNKLVDDSAKGFVSECDLALVCLGLGQKDKALDHLESGYEQRAGYMTNTNVDPVFDALRSEPRFKSIVAKMGLS